MSMVIARVVAFVFGLSLLWMALVVFSLPLTVAALRSPMVLVAVYLTIWILVLAGFYAIALALLPDRTLESDIAEDR